MREITESYINDYIEFVTEMISRYRKIGELANQENEISPNSVYYALSQYYLVSTALLSECQRARIKFEAESLEYKVWEDEAFEKAKIDVINDYEEKKIKPSITEFKTRMRIMNKDEYMKRNLSLLEAESKMKFFSNLSNILNKYDSILTTISYNMRSEMRSLSIEDRANATPSWTKKTVTRVAIKS